MLKLVGLIVLVGSAFGAGYYVGQRPVGDLKKSVGELSRNVLDTTLGLERNLRTRQGLVDAKSRLIQAKSEILDSNYGTAKEALAGTVESLELAAQAGSEQEKQKILNLSKRVQDVQEDVALGKTQARARLSDIQRDLDGML